MFKRPFSFDGRIRRLEYGLSLIIFYAYMFIIVFASQLFLSPTDPANATLEPLVMLLAMVPGYWFLIAQNAKRCHDLGNSGWFQLIPLYGLWLLFANGENGENRFGRNPKGQGNDADEIDQIGEYLQGEQPSAM